MVLNRSNRLHLVLHKDFFFNPFTTEDARVKQRLQVIHNSRIKLCNSKIYYDNPETVPPPNPTPSFTLTVTNLAI